MNLKPGDRVKVINGAGVILAEAMVERTGGATIFVRQRLPDGKGLSYRVPVSALEPVEVNTRPSLEEVVTLMRTCFGLSDKNESR